MAEDAEVLTTEEATTLLRVSTKTILVFACDGALPGEKVGRTPHFLRADVLDCIHGDRRRAGAAAT